MFPSMHDDPRYFTEEHRAFREQLRKFVESELVPHAEEWEAAGMFPSEVFRELGKRGFLGGGYPLEHGGSGGDYFFTCVLAEEMARCRSGGVTMGTLAHSEFGLRIVSDLGTPDQIEEIVKPCLAGEKIAAICVSEPDAGSNVAGAQTYARRDGDDYVVSGSKIYITNGTRADYLTMAVKTTEEGGHHGMSFICFPTKLDGKPTPGFEVSKSLKKLGMKSSDTALLSFDECRIPRRYLLGEENKGFYYIMRNFQGERLIAAQMSNMRARRAMEDTWRYMGERKIFGRYQREFQELRHWMADMLAHLLGMEAFTYEVTKRYIEEKDPPSKVVSMVKYYSTELSHHITDRCLQIHGGMGYMDETPISRAWRDGRLSTIGGGASEVMKEVIVKDIVREGGGTEDNSLYSPEEIELKNQATRFIREKIMPRIEEWESKGEMPKSVFQEFGEQGYLGIRFDEQSGGAIITEPGL
ncbi:MAG: acyl-CoA dehydrogenase family protein, partial [Chrysiogenetes bacterium]|nr:acyl-CoA dehydrogenase family protein [Chrysiogenetes bacterium]